MESIISLMGNKCNIWEKICYDTRRNFFADKTDAFDFVVDYVENNAYFLNCIYDSVGRDELKRFLYQDFIGIMKKIVRDCEEDLQVQLTDAFRHFLCNFYTEAIAGTVIDLFQHPDKYKKSELFEYFTVILRNSLPSILLSQGTSDFHDK